MHDLRARSRNVAGSLVSLFTFASFYCCIDFERCEDLVAHSVVVERQRKVSLDLDALHFADEGDPLEETTPLQAQKSEYRGICLLLSLNLLHLRDSLKVSEPTARNHKLLDLFGLLALKAGSCVQAKSVKGFSLQAQVDRIRADLSIELKLFLCVGVEHDRPESAEHEQVSHGEQRFGEVRPFF